MDLNAFNTAAGTRVLVTGAAGFIGYHVARALLEAGVEVLGVDNLNTYYDPQLKCDRLSQLGVQVHPNGSPVSDTSPRHPAGLCSTLYPGFHFMKLDLAQTAEAEAYFARLEAADLLPTHLCHLAAQAGVRYSLENPHAYVQSNVTAFVNLLELCRRKPPRHIVYASSSSVYGANTQVPFSETDVTDSPVSLYAATKKADELLAHAYARTYGLRLTGLRFFTVYGPWGRPDMAPILFARAICRGQALKVFNHGHMQRDFTYVDDIVQGLCRVLLNAPAEAHPEEGVPEANPRIYNIGRGRPVPLMDFIRCLQEALGREAVLDLQPMQPGDVPLTYADTRRLEAHYGYKPRTSLAEGISRFATWYQAYYGDNA